MSDSGLYHIARAIRFVGLCLFYAAVVKSSANPQQELAIIEREYSKS